MKTIKKIIPFLFLMALMVTVDANANSLKSIKYTTLPDNKLRITLNLAKPLGVRLKSFTIQDPPQIIVDLPRVQNALKKADQPQEVNLSVVQTITAVSVPDRTRIIIGLQRKVPYTAQVNGRHVDIVLSGKKSLRTVGLTSHRYSASHVNADQRHFIKDIDFHAAHKDGGRLVVKLGDRSVTADVQRNGQNVVVKFMNTRLPQRLTHKYDVGDFDSPVRKIYATSQGDNAQLKLSMRSEFDHFAYQIDNKFIVDIVPLASTQKKIGTSLLKSKYSGKRITLNFQDIKVRAVLQLLAEFTGVNIVVSDTVNGSITLRLTKVPWDQALDIILKTRGLDKRRYGSIMLVAPADEISARESKELLTQQKLQELSPLRAELIQINYAKAIDISLLLKDKNNSLLSARGSVGVDVRTNTLWVRDTAKQLQKMIELIHKLDIPVRQVLIEARIVTVDKGFERDLGVRFGITHPRHLSGTLKGANVLLRKSPEDVPVADRLNLDLPVIDTALAPASVGLALAKLGKNVLLDLELSALESEERGKVIASPRLLTANQQAASIESGEEIPYQEATASGATAVAFKKAVLSLQVIPHITPDNKIILELQVNQDIAGKNLIRGVPPILTKQIKTSVLVSNGETIVLGGIYEQHKSNTASRVPFLGTLPIVGHLFRNTGISDERQELLIFVTPKIIDAAHAGHA